MLTHGLIDTAKLYFQKDATKRSWFFADQFLHLGVILTAWYVNEMPKLNLNIFNAPSTIALITGLLFITIPTSVVIKMIISQWTPNFLQSTPTAQNSGSSLQNAGKYIGILERLFVIVFVLTSNWEAIGFLIAAKSVFRFGDLKDAHDIKLTEYVLIGTLLSFGIAIATGLLMTHILKFQTAGAGLFK